MKHFSRQFHILLVWILGLRFHVHYDFSDGCRHFFFFCFYQLKHNVSDAISSREIVLENLVWSTVKLLKWFLRLNHFYTKINKGHLRKFEGYSGRNFVFQLTTINIRKIVQKITTEIMPTKFFRKCQMLFSDIVKYYYSDKTKSRNNTTIQIF